MGTINDWVAIKWLAEFTMVVLILLTLISIVAIIKIWLEEKRKVNLMPKVPMTLCDIHGAYPSSSTLRLTVPAEGRADLIIEQCPQCYADKLRSSKRIPE